MAKKGSFKAIAFISVLATIIAIYFSYFRDLNVFYVFDDEFGYWSNGALVAGYDWSESLAGCAYYSYGYGILLSPIIKFIDTPSLMYQMAILLNVIMGCATFIIIFLCFRMLYKKSNYYKQLMVSGAISLSSGYAMNIHIAWSETLLNLLIWSLIFLLILYFSSKKWVYLLLSIVISGYALMVHPRAICVFISTLIIILFIRKNKILTQKQFLLSIISWIIMLIIWYGLKQYFKEILWKYGTEINDFSSEVQNFKEFFTVKGLSTFFFVFIGQLFYCGISSALISYFCIAQHCISVYKLIIKKNSVMQNEYFISLFLALVIISTLFLSSIALIDAQRIDHFVYGRYIEWLMMPAIGFGIMEILEKRANIFTKHFIIFVCLGFFLSGLLCALAIKLNDAENFFIGCSNALIIYMDANGLNLNQIFIYVFVLFGLVFLLSRKVHCGFYIGVLLVIGYNLIIMFTCLQEKIVPTHKYNNQILELAQTWHINHKDYPLYFLYSPDNWGANTTKDIFQFALKDTRIICKTIEQLQEEDAPYYLIVQSNNPFSPIPNKLELFHAKANTYIWETGNNNSGADVIQLDLSSFGTQIRNSGEKECYRSNGQQGFLLYGPYYHLEAGQYRATLTINTFEAPNANSIGYFEIVRKSQVFETKNITFNDHTVSIEFDLKNPMDNIELRLYLYSGVILDVEGIKLENNTEGNIL